MRGEVFPPGRNDPATPHGIRMIVSMVSGRRTPPQCLALEDSIDGMTEFEAATYQFPASVSALAIQQIGVNRAREVGGKWR